MKSNCCSDLVLIFEKIFFLDGQEKSNFQNFSNKLKGSLELSLNYLNINLYEKILRIGFFLARLRFSGDHITIIYEKNCPGKIQKKFCRHKKFGYVIEL